MRYLPTYISLTFHNKQMVDSISQWKTVKAITPIFANRNKILLKGMTGQFPRWGEKHACNLGKIDGDHQGEWDCVAIHPVMRRHSSAIQCFSRGSIKSGVSSLTHKLGWFDTCVDSETGEMKESWWIPLTWEKFPSHARQPSSSSTCSSKTPRHAQHTTAGILLENLTTYTWLRRDIGAQMWEIESLEEVVTHIYKITFEKANAREFNVYPWNIHLVTYILLPDIICMQHLNKKNIRYMQNYA